MTEQIQIDNLAYIKDIVVTIAAFVGMGLGCYNFWNEKNKEKVNIKVTPKSVLRKNLDSNANEIICTSENEFKIENEPNLFVIEIVNLSKFPIRISQVGFLVTGTEKRLSILPDSKLGNNFEWPKKLDVREAVTVYLPLKDIIEFQDLSKICCAFAETECGHIGSGTTTALKQLTSFIQG